MNVGLYQAYRNWSKRRRHRRKAELHLRDMTSLYSQFVRPDDLCFDIGANHGNRVTAFLALGARVVAVEPQPDCVCDLQTRFHGDPNVSIVAKAIDAAPGRAELHLSNADTLSSMSSQWIDSARTNPHFAGCHWDKTISVETTTLDCLIASHGVPVFCKIDVEGFEPNVLAGLSQPLRSVSFEFASDQPQRYRACLQRLAEIGDHEFNLSIGESMAFESDRWTTQDALEARLAQLARGPLTGGDIYARHKVS